MGGGVVSHCSQCDDYKENTFGVGMMFSELENIIDLFSPKARGKISILQNENVIQNTDFSYEIFKCAHCDTIHSRLNLEITYDENKVYAASYRCYECKRALRRTKREMQSFKCRNCGNHNLKEFSGGYMWD